MTKAGDVWTIPLDVAQADARAAAAGKAARYSWKCIDCGHVWGTSSILAYAAREWCPMCSKAAQ